MLSAKGFAAPAPKLPLEPFSFSRREPGAKEVLIDIKFCGVCHSDIHQVRDEWGKGMYPMVPGHEIVGEIVKVGSEVTKFKVGDLAGVGCFVDSCRTCPSCQKGLEQYCEVGMVGTYNSKDKQGNPTYGGYSNFITVDEQYTLKVSPKLDLAAVAPLLCAGVTTWSPLREWKVGKGHKVAIVGLGGLGHMAVKFAVSFGADVTVLSTSPSKEKDAKDLGAHNFAVTRDPEHFKALRSSFDFIIDTVSAPHDIASYTNLLKVDGTMILLGIPPEPSLIPSGALVMKRRRLVGSLIGGIKETQEMLDYCAEHDIVSDIELIPIQYLNDAYERVLKSDVRYRFVIDMASVE
ncbi:NAD(P)-dependent alcohol dehydrogenase [soil metagenome]